MPWTNTTNFLVMDEPGYQKNLYLLSLFQLKDEPEREGIRQLRKAPFYFGIG
jgi:hypothetical protein